MSTAHYRVPSHTERRSAANGGARVSSASNSEQLKAATRGGYGLKASDRRVATRDGLRPSEPGQRKPSAKGRDDGRLDAITAQAASRTGVAMADVARSWSPQASLISSTTAPLAPRISVPPLSAAAPKELQPLPFSELALDAQERAVIDDLLFVLIGFEGEYVQFVETYNPLEEKDRLAGPDFKILPGLDPSLRDLATSMLKVAKHYIALDAFIEVQSRTEFGMVNQALSASMRKLLKDYLILIAQLEHQQLTKDDFTLHIMNLHLKPTGHMLAQMYALSQEILRKNSALQGDLDDSDDLDDVDNIIESLRDGGEGVTASGSKMCKGGNVLGIITKRLAMMAGDPAARSLLTTLFRDASTPYMTMLNEWLHHGGIRDPHGEFLIREQKSIKREGLEQDYTDEYWEKRYTIREGDVPPQLESVRDKVLLAGKYLNVVRECGGVDISKEVQDVPTSFDDPHFLDNVNNAYTYANQSLLTLLITTHALPARLRSLKHYFFLDRSDFFSYFLEIGTSELRKPAKAVNVSKLQSLLEMSLRLPGSVATEDPFKEDVKVAMNEVSLTNWLMRIVNVTGIDQDAANNNANMASLFTPAAPLSAGEDDKDIRGFDAMVFDYSMPFPLSLVVSRVTLTRYQLIFRWLLSLRHLETLLLGVWAEHTNAKTWRHQSADPEVSLWKRKVWTLRARMLVFVQQLLYYCTAEVIEPNWQALMTRLRGNDGNSLPKEDSEPTPNAARRTVDELMQDHVDFLATCLKECMLTNGKLLRINSKVTMSCSLFASWTSSATRMLNSLDHDAAIANPSDQIGAANNSAVMQKLNDQLQRYENHFSRHLKVLVEALNFLAATETVAFLNLCARLSTANEGSTVGGNT